MNASEKAAELRALFVIRMETANDKYELPEYWRMNGIYAERGVEGYLYQGCTEITWFRIHPLSPWLLSRFIENRDRIEQGIPF